MIGAVARVPLTDSEGGWIRGECEGRHVASATLHASLGSFQRPMLDYTAVDIRYDAGAVQPYRPLSNNSGASSGSGGEGGGGEGGGPKMSAMERAFTFNGRLAYESQAVTLAATQQLLGPLRLRAELRCTAQAAACAAKSGWTELSRSDRGSGGGAGTGGSRFADMRAAVKGELGGAELVYGIDCPLPPALGAARLVAWYNVNRGEAMAEMRLFDL